MKKKSNTKVDRPAYSEYNKTLNCDEFIRFVKPFKHIRVGVENVSGGEYSIPKVYFKVTKKELVKTVRMDMMDVTFGVMINYDSRENNDPGTMFIQKFRMRLLDEK